ncbi:MAG TPA: tyrosine-type recombinase/integrase [Ktedonobacteraceae bacterium]|nr:tyrosine-type recombinase/integrase [Ktedonobacteraceae bacterium]
MSERAFPRTSVPLPHVISSTTFEQVMRAGFSQQTQARGAKRLVARDRALLWVLFDTGITVAEVCALRVADLDQHTGVLRVRGKGGNERQMLLRATCLNHLRSYLRQMNPASSSGLARRLAGGDPLFGSQGKQPLTKNGVTMVCVRFRTRAGASESTISPQVLRHSFALRYLQAGGNPRGLQELFGYEGMAPVRQYLRWYDQLLHEQTQQENEDV